MWKQLFRKLLPPLPLPTEPGLYQSLDSIRAWTLTEPGLYQSLDSNRTWTLSHLWTCWQAWLSKPAAYDLQGHISS